MPEPFGNPVTLHAFVDANHAGNVVTRWSHTGILLYLQRQKTVGTSTFRSEFVVLRTVRDMVILLRYKLRMLGLSLDGPAQIYCDDKVGVAKKTGLPKLVLLKNTMRSIITRWETQRRQRHCKYINKKIQKRTLPTYSQGVTRWSSKWIIGINCS
jgi:hypothetical protein